VLLIIPRHRVWSSGKMFGCRVALCTEHFCHNICSQIVMCQHNCKVSTLLQLLVQRGSGKRNTYRVWLGKPKERDYLEYLGVDRRKILKWILKKWAERVWTGFIWLRVRTSDGLLCTWQWACTLHIIWGSCWLAYEQGLCSVEFICITCFGSKNYQGHDHVINVLN